MTGRQSGPLTIVNATDTYVEWEIDGYCCVANEREIQDALIVLEVSESLDVVRLDNGWLDESDLRMLQARMAIEREKRKAARQNRAEWNAEAVEAQHRFRTDDARADYIADNYSPEGY